MSAQLVDTDVDAFIAGVVAIVCVVGIVGTLLLAALAGILEKTRGPR